jgi:hypothetical protein
MLRGKLYNMKLFIDDLRDPPDDTWTVVRTGREAIEYIKKDVKYQDTLPYVCYDDPKLISHISFDHDLADTNTPEVTGYTVMRFIEDSMYYDYYEPPFLEIHSANPVGRKNMQACIDAIERHEEQRLRGN